MQIYTLHYGNESSWQIPLTANFIIISRFDNTDLY